MKSKAKGLRNERKTRKYLDKRGYYTSRSAGSLGTFDVFAIPQEEGCVKLIQVKTNRGPSKIELKRIEKFDVPYYVSKEIWIWDDWAREPRIIDCNEEER